MWCLLLATLYTFRPSWFPTPIIRPVFCFVTIIFIFLLTKMKLGFVVSSFLISYGISYVLYYISSFFIFFLFMPYASSGYESSTIVNYNTPFYLISFLVVSFLQLLLSFYLFRIRRLKNGFPFLLKRYSIVVALILTGTVLVLVTFGKSVNNTNDVSIIPLLFTGILTIGVGIIIWIRRGISLF